ncbi:sensor histidine kinase [Paenibacillus cymbidii]|uniref:sensor histidine kinase n=1 Tax=Paenibacillus cymbidii TaxID=1639034 RepID=UPI001081F10D|nr:sensor histidine kinase [Paenibacillus cymbidii]
MGYAFKWFRHKRISFTAKLVITFALVLSLASLLVGAFVYQLNLHLYEQEVYKQYSAANEQMLERFVMKVEEVSRISQTIVFHPDVITSIQNSNRSTKDRMTIEEFKELMNFHDRINQARVDAPYIRSVFVYNMNGENRYFDNNGSVFQLDASSYTFIRKQLEGTSGMLVWLRMPLPSSVDPGAMRDSIVAARWMKTLNQETYGILIFTLGIDFIKKFMGEMELNSGMTFLITPGNHLLYSNHAGVHQEDIPLLTDQKNMDVAKFDGGIYLFVKHQSESGRFTLISGTSLEQVRSKTKQLFTIVVVSGLTSITLTILVIIMVSMKLTRPLQTMVQAMRSIRAGHLETKVRVATGDELAFLGEGFNAMVDHINELIREDYVKQVREREAELKMLQAQLNPHFLYNIFNEIYWKLRNQNAKDTADIIKSLSDILRYSLQTVRQPTTLQEELAQVRNYLHIQMELFHQDLQYTIDVPEELFQCQIIRLLVQPIVENVFVHAFRHRRGHKQLTISGMRENDKLILSISDNGCGIVEDNMHALLGKAKSVDQEHLGIRMVRRRIELTYGEMYGLDIISKWGDGTSVTLTLPYLEEEAI